MKSQPLRSQSRKKKSVDRALESLEPPPVPAGLGACTPCPPFKRSISFGGCEPRCCAAMRCNRADPMAFIDVPNGTFPASGGHSAKPILNLSTRCDRWKSFRTNFAHLRLEM